MRHQLLLRQLKDLGIDSQAELPDKDTWQQLLDQISHSYEKAEGIYLPGVFPGSKRADDNTGNDLQHLVDEVMLRSVLDAIAEGVCALDLFGKLRYLNPVAEKLLGYKGEELIGQDFWAVVDGSDGDVSKPSLQELFGGNRFFQNDDSKFNHKDGGTFSSCYTISAVCAGERCVGSVVVFQDITERKRVEERLLTLSAAVSQSPNAVFITNLQGDIVYANPCFSELTGYSFEEVMGKNPHILKSRETQKEKHKNLWKTIRDGGEWRGEIQDRRKNGDLYWAFETVSPIRDLQGVITHYLSIQKDITAQKNAQEALKISEERFRQVADMAGEWIWEQDTSGRYIYSSSAILAVVGYAPDEIIGKHYLELFTREDRDYWSSQGVAYANLQHGFSHIVNRYRHKDGHEVYTESTGKPIYDENGHLVKWRGVDHDITARKTSEDTLRLRDRSIEAVSIGISISDAQQKDQPNIYVNPALCRMTGYSQSELIGKNMRLLQGAETDPAAIEEIRNAVKDGQDCQLVLKNYKKDGTLFWNELLISPVRDDTGNLTHFIGVQTDVTERRRAEEENHELEIARHIQQSLLPKAPLQTQNVEVAGYCLPAAHIGGDYFDYYQYHETIDAVIADVSGHSVGAALIMAEARSALKAEMRNSHFGSGQSGCSAAFMLHDLNEVLFEDLNRSDFFITMFYVKYDTKSGELRYANAGHNRALLLRKDAQSCIQLDAEGLILGVKCDVSFEEKSLAMVPGDMLLLYTDGITEAQNKEGDFFGVSKLCSCFTSNREKQSQAIITALIDRMESFCQTRAFLDDVTLLILKVR